MNLIDYILDLFRSPDAATAFITDPDGALRNVGLQNVSAAQIQAVAATAAPAGIALGGGNPILGLQRAVSDYHGISAPFQPSFAQQNDLASHNDTQLASNNDFMSPDQAGGTNAQNGAFNLGFGDITLGDKTENTATGHGVVVAGDNGGDIVSGDGAVLGNNNHVNNGDVYAGTGSNVNMGDGTIHDNGTTATNGSTVIQGNEGPVFNDVDASGGNGGGANAGGAHGGGSLIGIGGGNASGGSAAGGNAGGGGITYVDNKTDSHTDNSSHVDTSVQQHSAVTTEENHETNTHVDSTTDNHSVTGVSNEGNTMDNSTHFQPHDNHIDAF